MASWGTVVKVLSRTQTSLGLIGSIGASRFGQGVDEGDGWLSVFELFLPMEPGSPREGCRNQSLLGESLAGWTALQFSP